VRFINNLNAAHKLVIGIILGIIAYFLTSKYVQGNTERFLTAWNIFSFSYLTLNWITFWSVNAHQIRREAAIQNVGRILVFMVALTATLVALIAVMQLLLNKINSLGQMSFSLATGISGLLLSWILLHSIFTLRYAHVFYANHKLDKDKHAGGLVFPEEPHPDFIDFAYYSFVIGMTFQVSDVSATSKALRRLTLLHSLISFAFNTIIVALTVNVIAGLAK